MSKKDFSDLDDQIKDIMKKAFDAVDFAGIKKDIDVKTEKTINEVKIKVKDKSEYMNRKMKDKMKTTYETVNNMTGGDKKKIQKYIAKRPAGNISGLMYIILGSLGSSLFGILLIIYFFAIQNDAIIYIIGLIIMLSFFGGSIGLIFKGKNSRKRVRRFKQYANYLEDKTFCLIEDLASLVEKKNKFIVKDLRKMIELNMFPQGHIDEKQTYFMLNNQVYEDYLISQEALKKRTEEELKKQDELNNEENDPLRKELRYTIEAGKKFIEEMKSVNNDIEEEMFSIKLNKLQDIISHIFNYVEKNPKKLTEVSRFINQYLPMTLKLVNAYRDLSNQTVQGDNIRTAKNEIENAIDNINIAFENLLDNLFEEVALDISTDISVLETLFTQEGLNKRDFEKIEFRNIKISN